MTIVGANLRSCRLPLLKMWDGAHHHGKNELMKQVGLQECHGARGGIQKKWGEEKEKKGEGEAGEGRKVKLSKQNQMQECGGSFDLCPRGLIDVAHFISLSES